MVPVSALQALATDLSVGCILQKPRVSHSHGLLQAAPDVLWEALYVLQFQCYHIEQLLSHSGDSGCSSVTVGYTRHVALASTAAGPLTQCTLAVSVLKSSTVISSASDTQ